MALLGVMCDLRYMHIDMSIIVHQIFILYSIQLHASIILFKTMDKLDQSDWLNFT